MVRGAGAGGSGTRAAGPGPQRPAATRPAGLEVRLPTSMDAWAVTDPGPAAPAGRPGAPLQRVRRGVAHPGPEELLVRVEACGVCRTDLHLAEGDLPPHGPGRVPGHEVVGRVVAHGSRLAGRTGTAPLGSRVGIAWLRSTCGTCRWCARGEENLCPLSRYTGWDADGGYAEFATVPAAFALPLPEGPAAELAPLLCAGIIGYRALRRARVLPGMRVGLYGFGASAHLAAQVALAQGCRVHVLTRSERARALARELGAASAGPADGRPPEPLDAAVLFAPAGELVPVALAALDRGGTLAVAGIHLTDIPPLSYAQHLFQERSLRSVTSYTRADARGFLTFAATHPLRVVTTSYSMSEADVALADLAEDRVDGAAVLIPDEP
ncbi:MAG TPA: zinc-dependent alcohol dehydrogenase family protein [Motilibacteraceae bacterium]|nr:zinc-dependent alcohol dehydrogenase family protein [Motilibacteraceae bacterium]